jgi:hypothetical protein
VLHPEVALYPTPARSNRQSRDVRGRVASAVASVASGDENKANVDTEMNVEIRNATVRSNVLSKFPSGPFLR